MKDTEGMNDIESMCPGPEPDGETPVSENRAFVDACMAVASGEATELGWHLGKHVLTHSDTWGYVFRVDLARDNAEIASAFGRFICWSGERDDVVMGTAFVPGFGLKPL